MPSIGPSTWLSASAVLLVVLALVQLYPRDGVARPGEARFGEHAWAQPIEIEQSYPKQISADQWQFNVEEVEDTFSRLQFDERDRLILSPDTAELLDRFAQWQYEQGSRLDENRLELLIRKRFPGARGANLGAMLQKAVDYHAEKQELDLLVVGSAQKNEYRQRLQVLQQQAFGAEVAQALFGERNRLNDYLTARRAVLANNSLSEPEKKARLTELENAFRNHRHSDL